jgi:spermidine synthase
MPAARGLLPPPRLHAGPRRRPSVTTHSSYSESGSWEQSPEWWGTGGGGWGRSGGRVMFRETSMHGNGEVTVTAHDHAGPGEWRVLRFGEAGRQSVSLVRPSVPGSVAQDSGVLAFEYTKTIAAATMGMWRLTGLRTKPRILCIGGGGCSLPAFVADTLASQVVVAEIDPVVARASALLGFQERAGLAVRVAPGETVVSEAGAAGGAFDICILDAFDGDDAVPEPLVSQPFVDNLARALHPGHGLFIMNLHGGGTSLSASLSNALAGRWQESCRALHAGYDASTVLGRKVQVAKDCYAEALSGAAFTLSVAFQDNIILCIARGLQAGSTLRTRLAAAADEAAMQYGVRFQCGWRAVRGLTEAEVSCHNW